jgi:hypothetical protein
MRITMNQAERERYFRIARAMVERYESNWDESKHKRGQPKNAGQFGPGGGQAKPATTGKPPAASPPATGRPEEKAQPWPGHENDARPRPAPPLTHAAPVASPPATGGPEEKAQPWPGHEAATPPDGAVGPEKDPTTAPPPGKMFNVDPSNSNTARVGVPADEIPPPPKMEPLPNLAPDERAVESRFMRAFQMNPNGMAEQYRRAIYASDKPKTFETDAAKNLSDDWTQNGQPDDVRKAAQAQWNTALHGTANAITKRAFMMHLDDVAKLPEDQRRCLVTAGGCGAGKGYALKNVTATQPLQDMSAAIWDSAGDQNSTECQWVHDECKSRGIKATFVYVHADPVKIWADPERGVVSRANKEGRMVAARVFADSHTWGARHFQKFADSVQNDDSAEVIYLDNSRGATPEIGSGIPPEALQQDSDALNAQCVQILQQAEVSSAVRRGGLASERYWSNEQQAGSEA